MPVTILDPAGVDKRAAVVNAQFARPFNVGAWSKIRVAFRMAVTDTGANLTGDVVFAMGICSGSTNLWGDATCQHAIGAGRIVNNWTRSAGGPSYSMTTNSNWQAVKKVGTTITNGSNLGVLILGAGAATGSTKGVFALDITKGSPNFTLQAFARNASATTDISQTAFYDWIEVESYQTLTSHGNGSAMALAVDEGANGTLDHVFFYWSRSTPVFHISDIAVVRFA